MRKTRLQHERNSQSHSSDNVFSEPLIARKYFRLQISARVPASPERRFRELESDNATSNTFLATIYKYQSWLTLLSPSRSIILDHRAFWFARKIDEIGANDL